MKPALLFAGIFLFSLWPCSAQEKASFPTDDEIQLLLTQADRAMQQYKPLIDQEEKALGKRGADAVAKDRQVVQAIETSIEILKKKPQGFNSAAGFLFSEWLDDATRNALLCSQTAMSDASIFAISGKATGLDPLTELSKSCMDVSTLIYTVSENAGALYERYAKAEQDIAERAFESFQKCTAILKKETGGQKQ
jgi:hypothetical protein